jgi:putative hydrolase of the HAD superfamily
VTLRAITFDYGGTLDGPARHWLDRFVALYRACGLDYPFERVREAFYRADAAAYAADEPERGLAALMEFHVGVQLAALGVKDGSLQRRLVERFVADSEAALAASRRVLTELAPHYRLGVISNFYGNVARILADAGIAPLLGVIVDSNRAGVQKPDPRLFGTAVAALGVEPAATLHVGDSYERDVCGARAAGLRTAWLVADSARAAGTADLRLRSLDELLALPAGVHA